MKTPLGIELAIGQKWREVDKRFTRIVEVRSWIKNPAMVLIKCSNRRTWAKLSRFNGKTHCYEPYSLIEASDATQ